MTTKTVPMEATDEQIDAMREVLMDGGGGRAATGGLTHCIPAMRAMYRAAIEAAPEAEGKPVAWTRTDDILDDEGRAIGTDEPRVVWGSEHPDQSETWWPLYAHPAPEAEWIAVGDDPVDAFLADVRAELIRARAKFPGDRIIGLALAEEFGELMKAMLDESAAAVRKEAVQTAVMAARVVLDGDSSVRDWRHERGLDALLPITKPNPPKEPPQ